MLKKSHIIIIISYYMPYISFLLVWPCLVNFPNIILYIIIVKSYLMHHTNMHISNFSTLLALATGSHTYLFDYKLHILNTK